jgi:uncharacterized protein YdeI (YjbR/CyaY-like superfamily)
MGTSLSSKHPRKNKRDPNYPNQDDPSQTNCPEDLQSSFDDDPELKALL